MNASVVAVHKSPVHEFSKDDVGEIRLVEGFGVEGDAHFGETVQHRSRVAKDPSQPNLRQVHLIHEELLNELANSGLHVLPGDMGENITTMGVPLLQLSAGTLLRIGETAVVCVTGLRNPCAQIENFMPGLLANVLDKRDDGSLVRKAGVMGVVVQSGIVRSGDSIAYEVPAAYVPLAPV
ncbi:MOSC domain-containing protein [Aquitalea sp.]|uniref:MOSC domain-containing protein n=1 Tax=Aquitalea sp. TaxID=1872623 RepID=UPI00258349EC|nr:MOSC domain-containing protein [Aquitalea sp.]